MANKYGDMLKVTHYQGNANQNHEISSHTFRVAIIKITKEVWAKMWKN